MIWTVSSGLPTGALALAAGIAAGLAGWLSLPHGPTPRRTTSIVSSAGNQDSLHRHRLAVCGVAGLGVGSMFEPPLSFGVTLCLGVVVWVVIGRVEPRRERREREAAQRYLAPLVDLFAAALNAGSAPTSAIEVACQALPGAGADRLVGLRRRLSLGEDPERAWKSLTDDPVLAPLGRAVARALHSGAPIAAASARLAQDLALEARANAEDRARAVGVKAALPLGLCLLPSFLLIGIVPVAASLLASLTG